LFFLEKYSSRILLGRHLAGIGENESVYKLLIYSVSPAFFVAEFIMRLTYHDRPIEEEGPSSSSTFMLKNPRDKKDVSYKFHFSTPSPLFRSLQTEIDAGLLQSVDLIPLEHEIRQMVFELVQRQKKSLNPSENNDANGKAKTEKEHAMASIS
jgi:hypothetical protein